MQNTDEASRGIFKKNWLSPTLVLIGSSTVSGGSHVNVHEGSVASSHKVVNPTSSGGPGFTTTYRFHHHGTPNTYTGRHHPLNFYNS